MYNVEKFNQHMVLSEIGIRKHVVPKEEPESEQTLSLLVDIEAKP